MRTNFYEILDLIVRFAIGEKKTIRFENRTASVLAVRAERKRRNVLFAAVYSRI